ncbi:MAG: hypothetical protein WDA71_07860 [Actinomycetota bacterium]
MGDITAVVHEESDETVFDYSYAPDHKERRIFAYRADGMYMTFVGAKFTCGMAPPQTSDETYDPPLLEYRSPLAVGITWEGKSSTGSSTVTSSGRVLRRERIRVPAGTFDAFVVESRTDFTGDTEGHALMTDWLVPDLGIWVKQTAAIDMKRGSATFQSNYTSELVTTPK